MTPQPIKNLDTLTQNPELWKRRESFTSNTGGGFNPLIYGNDVDSVDVATRVAMVSYMNITYAVFNVIRTLIYSVLRVSSFIGGFPHNREKSCLIQEANFIC